MSAPLDDYLRFHENALSLRAQRQQLLASNIANADTPNFKARDLDFSNALQSALKGSTGAPALAKTAVGHLSGNPEIGQGANTPQYRQMVQGSVDGNTVDMDVERNQFADNAIRYEAGLTMISAQIRNLLATIQGGQ